MSKRSGKSVSGAMLDLWRPPGGAGDAVGCLATTYTFSPGLFDEQCLARFLEIESEPNREDLAFMLERESRLGGVYVGVLVDHTQAGVEHSFRWDVLPVRARTGKQHAKISMLAWSHHIRIIVASANLTKAGYRTNQEVASAINLTPGEADTDAIDAAVDFLRTLISLVPGVSASPPAVQRARAFLDQVALQVRDWRPRRKRSTVRQHLSFTLPSVEGGRAARSSLEEAVQVCRRRGGSPSEVWVASPFFDANDDAGHVTSTLCKVMARGERRELTFCVPAMRDEHSDAVPRLAAPIALLRTPLAYQGKVSIEMLPEQDGDKNRRPWHAKMLAFLASDYFALMVGSSNFTCAGMGVGQYRNAEANLVTVVDQVEYGREVGQLEAVWPEMDRVTEPESAAWLGARLDHEEEEQAKGLALPAGFLSATYRAGAEPQIVLQFDPAHLPDEWMIHACGQEERDLLSAPAWREYGRSSVVEVAWPFVHAPERLLVRWVDHEAFMPLNVEDSRDLAPPSQLERMSADDMLWILAAADPSAAFRAWATTQIPSDLLEADLDSPTPIDLDPLQRYDLQATFLHRVRRRARILAELRSNLQRPVWGLQALEWRLRGIVGVEPLANRLVKEFARADCAADESLLTLADLLIVLQEVEYQPSEGSLPKEEFEKSFRLFLQDLANKIEPQIKERRCGVPQDIMHFWERVVERCR